MMTVSSGTPYTGYTTHTWLCIDRSLDPASPVYHNQHEVWQGYSFCLAPSVPPALCVSCRVEALEQNSVRCMCHMCRLSPAPVPTARVRKTRRVAVSELRSLLVEARELTASVPEEQELAAALVAVANWEVGCRPMMTGEITHLFLLTRASA